MEWAYLAGLFDGEGSLSLRVGQHHGVSRTIQFCIVNTDIGAMREISEFLKSHDISNTLYIRKRDNTKQKDIATVRISNRYILQKLIPLLLPYCIIKKPALIAGLSFIEGFTIFRRNFTQKELDKVKELYSSGLNYETIGKQVGCGRIRIWTELRRAGEIKHPWRRDGIKTDV